MALITKVSELVGAHQSTVDLSVNTLGVGDLQVGSTLLSQTGAFALFVGVVPGTSTSVSIVANWSGTTGNSIALVFDGSSTITSVINAWNISNPTNEATLTSGDGTQIPTAQTVTLAGGINAGSSLVGDTASYQHFTPTSATVAGALAGIDIALGSVAGGSQKVDLFTLDNTEITNKYVILSATPAIPSETILLVEDAGNMFYGDDFSVSANHLSWSGLDLDGILSVGDNLTVTYSS